MSKNFTDKQKASEAGSKSSNKGQSQRKTKEWEQLGEFITQAGAQRFADIMNTSDDDTFADMYLKALNYFKPKINHNINEETEPVNEIKIIVKK